MTYKLVLSCTDNIADLKGNIKVEDQTVHECHVIILH